MPIDLKKYPPEWKATSLAHARQTRLSRKAVGLLFQGVAL